LAAKGGFMSNRMDKVNAEMQRVISDILRNGIKDPRFTELTSVTKVDCTNDFKHAKIYLSIMGDGDKCAATFNAVKNAGGFIKNELAHRMSIRAIPELSFFQDSSIADGFKIDEIIKKL
jgi:ribosome-binding factor A